jgi:hypothetical protein
MVVVVTGVVAPAKLAVNVPAWLEVLVQVPVMTERSRVPLKVATYELFVYVVTMVAWLPTSVAEMVANTAPAAVSAEPVAPLITKVWSAAPPAPQHCHVPVNVAVELVAALMTPVEMPVVLFESLSLPDHDRPSAAKVKTLVHEYDPLTSWMVRVSPDKVPAFEPSYTVVDPGA